MFYLKGAYLNNQPRRNSLSFNKVEKAGRELHPFDNGLLEKMVCV